MWVVKHAPASFSEFVGNKTAVEKLLNHDWKKPLLVYGPGGCGKTTLAHLLAKEKGWDVVSVTDENLDSAENMSQTSSLFGGTRLILVDDIDLIKDKKSCEELVRQTRNPTIAVTQDFSSKKLVNIKKICEKVNIRKPMKISIQKHLSKICEREKITASQEILKEIVENGNGDIRSSVNDLETLAAGRERIVEADLALLYARDSKKDIYSFLGKVYGGESVSELSKLSFDLDEQPSSILFWIGENVPRIYSGNLKEAFNFLSRADIFLGRIRNRQYWGFLRYASPLMSGGVSVSRPEKISFSRYVFPSFYGMLGRTKKERSLQKSIAGKASPHLHVSSRVFADQYVRLYRNLLRQAKLDSDELKGFFDLTDDELEYLSG